MPSFLVNDMRTGTPGTVCEAFRYVNATPTSLGTFGSYVGNAASANASVRNQIIQFQGQIYALARDGVYQKDDPTVDGGTWTIALTFANPSTAGNNRDTYWGIFPAEIGGALRLVGVRPAGGSAWVHRWFEFDGTTWTEAASDVATFPNFTYLIDVVQYRGLLIALYPNGTPCVFDPVTKSVSVLATIPSGAQRDVGGFCVFDDRLFLVAITSGYLIQVYEYTGTGFVAVAGADGHVIRTGIGYVGGRFGVFTDGTYMYCIAQGPSTQINNNDDGFRCLQWDTSLGAPTNISAAVLPSYLRPVADGGTYPPGLTSAGLRATIMYDQESVPGTGDIYVGITTSLVNGSAFSLHKWNGNAALMTAVDSGGNVFHALPTTLPQGGSRTFVPGELDVKIASRAAVFGGEQITFRAYGGGTGHTVKILYSVGGDPDLLEATLIGPVTGGAATLNSMLNQVEGVAGDGATDYTVVWDHITDGIAANTVLSRFPQITV